jgi:adenylate kinase family enzyme
VIGHTGSGKTTFSRALAQRLALPYVELDALHWRSGWVMAPPEDLRAQVAELMAGDGWVIDGNWTVTLGTTVFDAADEIVWLDLPFQSTFRRLLRRTLSRLRTREPLWETTNRETFRSAFLSRDSILLYSITNHRRRRRRSLQLVENRPHVRLRSPAEVERYLAEAQ